MSLRACLCVLTLAASSAVAQKTFPFGSRLDGKPVQRLGGQGTKAVVLYFVASDCPVSNRTFPEMRRLSESFAKQGVRFWFVYPNVTEKPRDVRSHQTSFDPAEVSSAITDPSSSLVKLARVGVTPEVAVLVPGVGGWRQVYSGRIDDRFAQIGLERHGPIKALAQQALTEALAGIPVTQDHGTPVGCSIIPSRMVSR